jgi:hypothetical protein
MSLPEQQPIERRQRHRYNVGVPVRVLIEGIADPIAADLSDVSASGCLLRSEEVSFLADPGERLAFGFVTQSRDVALVRGRVVRRAPGHGLAVIIEQANGAFDELLGRLAGDDFVAA